MTSKRSTTIRNASLDALEPRRLMSRTYFVAPWGDDAGPGTSVDRPFRSIARANQLDLNPGDQIAFASGRTFTGTLRLTAEDAGTADNPVVIRSYGRKRATITSTNDKGVLVQNAGGVVVRDLIIKGGGPETTVRQGLHFQNTLGFRQKFIRVRNVDVTGWGLFGIAVQGTGNHGFEDVKIEHVAGYNNGTAAIALQGPNGPNNVNRNVTIQNSWLFDNPGRANRGTEPQGSGVHVAASQDVTVQYVSVRNNGWRGNASAGIWATRSDRVTFQYNIVEDQKANGQDGGGFDMGGGVTNSITQYNFTRNNHGAGYGMLTWVGAFPTTNNIIRYNVSQNDGRRNGYAGIAITANSRAANDLYVYNNVVYMSPAQSGSPRAIWTHHYIPRITISNNIFYTTGDVVFARFRDNSGWNIQGNVWHNDSGIYRFEHNNRFYDSYNDWRNASGAERLNGQHVGSTADPKLKNPGNAPRVWNAPRMRTILDDFYTLEANSPVINKGISINFASGASLSSSQRKDFFGNVFSTTQRPDIGVHELVR